MVHLSFNYLKVGKSQESPVSTHIEHLVLGVTRAEFRASGVPGGGQELDPLARRGDGRLLGPADDRDECLGKPWAARCNPCSARTRIWLIVAFVCANPCSASARILRTAASSIPFVAWALATLLAAGATDRALPAASLW